MHHRVNLTENLGGFHAMFETGGSSPLKWLLILVLVVVVASGIVLRDDISQAIAAGDVGGQFQILKSLGNLGDAISDSFRRGFGTF